jgi:hypothetical protein
LHKVIKAMSFLLALMAAAVFLAVRANRAKTRLSA